MYKRLTAIAAVFIFFIAILPVFAAQIFNAQTAVSDALENSGFYYKQENKNGNNLNYVSIPILSDYLKGDSYYGCLVYGNSHGDLKENISRYLGYTLSGEDYTNVAFPPDVSHNGYLEDQQWIIRPWRDDSVWENYPTINRNNGLDGTERCKQNIIQGILTYYTNPDNANNYQIKGIIPDTYYFWNNSEQYVHILAPPTKCAWGIGRIWRHEGGNVFYMTVPLMPDILLPELDNLKAISIDPGVSGEAQPNSEYTATVIFKSESKKMITAVPVGAFNREYRAVLKDANGNEVQYADFGPGESKTFYFIYHTDYDDCFLKGVINIAPVEQKFQESDYNDNVVTAAVNVKEIEPRQGDPRLHLQAWSDPGEDIYGNWHDSVARPPFTAKWSDSVHATLTIPRPTPPKGWLDWWEISWSNINYPKQNQEFSFGTPYPPEGTITKAMDIPGQGLEAEKEAILEFQEDWAMDGAGIYSQIEERLMAEDPKYYTIAVNFKVTYQYSYIVYTKDGPEIRTRTKNYTDTAAADLLVNGTGRGFWAE